MPQHPTHISPDFAVLVFAPFTAGALGNCWLLSALASLSSTSTTLEECFVTQEWNPRGRYTCRLWDNDAGKYVNVSVDDYFPVSERSGK